MEEQEQRVRARPGDYLDGDERSPWSYYKQLLLVGSRAPPAALIKGAESSALI